MFDFRLISLVCTVHNLKYEYPAAWDDSNLPAPACPICQVEEINKLEMRFNQLKRQYDVVMEAIEIKRNYESDKDENKS